jgi:hypothetical protein
MIWQPSGSDICAMVLLIVVVIAMWRTPTPEGK